jgi:hypothetical protein
VADAELRRAEGDAAEPGGPLSREQLRRRRAVTTAARRRAFWRRLVCGGCGCGGRGGAAFRYGRVFIGGSSGRFGRIGDIRAR